MIQYDDLNVGDIICYLGKYYTMQYKKLSGELCSECDLFDVCRRTKESDPCYSEKEGIRKNKTVCFIKVNINLPELLQTELYITKNEILDEIIPIILKEI